MITIAARLLGIVAALRTAIGVFAARQARAQPVVWLGAQAFAPSLPPNQPATLPDDTWLLLYNRLARLGARFQVLYARWQTNTLPQRRPKAPRQARRQPSTPPARLPRAFSWVNQRIPESAPPAGQLDALLHAPETQQFVAAAPQAGRLLRPLCHALGVPLPGWLSLPPRARRPRPRPAPRPRAPSLTDPSLRLPAHVIAAARAWKRKCG